MKLTYENLDKIHLSAQGNLRKGGTLYIERETCLKCGEPYLTTKSKPGKFCCWSCGSSYTKRGKKRKSFSEEWRKNLSNSMRGKHAGTKNPMYGIRSPGYIDGRSLNPDYVKRYRKKYREKNKNYFDIKRAEYRTSKLNQTPMDVNQKEISKFYKLRDVLNSLDWAQYQVDHIKGLKINGLHHEDNLQVLEKGKNQSKPKMRSLTRKEKIKCKGITLQDIKNHPQIFNVLLKQGGK